MDRDELTRRILALTKDEKTRLSDFVGRYLSREHDREDAVQETLTIALVNGDSLRPDGDLVAWLMGIAFNVARDMVKLRYRRDARKESLASAENVEGHEASPVASSEADERSKRVHAEVRALPENERVVVELNVFGGLSQTQIAEALGWSLAQVKNRARAAHERLLDRLKDLEI